MRIQSLHNGFIMPTKGSEQAGAYDIYMPRPGFVNQITIIVCLGFAAEIPVNHVALLLPRSSTGAKHGIELNNTCGVIDSDYRGEWKAALKTKGNLGYSWEAGDRVLQFIIVPVLNPILTLVESLNTSHRGDGGFGSSGK